MPRWDRPYGPPGMLRKLVARTLADGKDAKLPSNKSQIAALAAGSDARKRRRLFGSAKTQVLENVVFHPHMSSVFISAAKRHSVVACSTAIKDAKLKSMRH